MCRHHTARHGTVPTCRIRMSVVPHMPHAVFKSWGDRQGGLLSSAAAVAGALVSAARVSLLDPIASFAYTCMSCFAPTQLTASNLEVKKFVAFQEGFERLFDIMSGESMLEGGSVIVKDCLHVCLNLLSGSSLTKVNCT